MPLTRILIGDARERLRTLPDASAHCVVTSPPYWGLRDYGVEGQLGLEPTPDEYVRNLVAVFREVRRVLRDDGVVWLVLGDSFATGAGKVGAHPGGGAQGARWTGHRGSRGGSPLHVVSIGPTTQPNRLPQVGLKPKDLVGIPWMVAFALRADGWWLRSDVVWAKRNPMPESVRDRPTRAHEFVFLLAKSERYFFDAEAIREPFAEATIKRIAQITFNAQRGGPKDGINPNRSSRRALVNLKGRAMPEQLEDRPHKSKGRNIRSVWSIATKPFAGAHFATFPPALVEPCIKAGSSERGCCRCCGAPWLRNIERRRRPNKSANNGKHDGTHYRTVSGGVWNDSRERRDLGWRPTCGCAEAEPVPCTVLDPFAGAGTTALVAAQLGRDAILVELNPAYAELTRSRLESGRTQIEVLVEPAACEGPARAIV